MVHPENPWPQRHSSGADQLDFALIPAALGSDDDGLLRPGPWQRRGNPGDFGQNLGFGETNKDLGEITGDLECRDTRPERDFARLTGNRGESRDAVGGLLGVPLDD